MIRYGAAAVTIGLASLLGYNYRRARQERSFLYPGECILVVSVMMFTLWMTIES